MSSSRYTPSVHQPATVREIQKISDDLLYHCSPDEVQVATENVNILLGSLQILDNLCEPVPEVKYPRTPGYRPKPEDRYGNSWTWRCDIVGAPSGKLSGKTLAIKDNTAVAGVPMSNGSRLLEGYIPEYDASVVTRILDAGGRILGKSSNDDFCTSAMGFSSTDGYIFNPEDPEYRVGGSSGGSAVLVAGGQVDMALGGDQGGSVRIPAAWTGTVGFKPTYGLVPYTGAISIDPSFDHLGPITKNVTDSALLLEVIAGPDGLDGRQEMVVNIPKYSLLLESDVSGKVLGVLKEGFETCAQETQIFVQEFLKTVGQAGLSTIDVSVPLDESVDHLKNTVAADLTGHPALSLPLGKLGDGRTDSLMIVGRKFDELTVLQVARALEKIIPARNG